MTRLLSAAIGLIVLSGCGMEDSGTSHPHEEPHGMPMTVAALERDLIGMA